MKKGSNTTLHPLLGGLIGGAVIPVAAVILSVLAAAVLSGTSDPNSYVLVSACAAVALGGCIGGFLAVKLTGALISGVYSAVAALVIMAAVSAFLPESEGVLSRILPPVILAVSPLLGGYLGLGKKKTGADVIKKATKQRIKR